MEGRIRKGIKQKIEKWDRFNQIRKSKHMSEKRDNTREKENMSERERERYNKRDKNITNED